MTYWTARTASRPFKKSPAKATAAAPLPSVRRTLVAPVPMLIALGLGTLLIAITRYVSLGSVVGSALAGLLLCWVAVATGEPAWAVWGVLVGGFIVVAHRDNIERLLAGTERKLGERAL